MRRALVALILLSTPALAAKTPSCGRPDKKGRVPGMREVMACQAKAREDFAASVRKKKRRDPTFEEVDAFDDRQRAEMREYLEEHPAEATIDETREAERQAEKAGGVKGVLERVGAAAGVAKEKVRAAMGGKPAREARQTLGGLKDGARMEEIDLDELMEKAREDPQGTLKRAVVKRKKEFEENVPEEAKRFYKKPQRKD